MQWQLLKPSGTPRTGAKTRAEFADEMLPSCTHPAELDHMIGPRGVATKTIQMETFSAKKVYTALYPS